MSDTPQTQPPGWYYAQGDPPGTQRYWDGQKWEGGPQPVPGAGADAVAGAVPGLAEPIMRIGARLIDYLVWFADERRASRCIFVGGVAAGQRRLGRRQLRRIVPRSASWPLRVITAYETFLVGSRGQTLGKMALGLRVVRADGSAPDMKDGFMRILPYTALGVLGASDPDFCPAWSA